MNRAWIYCRTACNVDSLDMQKKRLESFATEQGLSVVGISFDQGSELRIDLPGLLEVKQAAADKRIDVLLAVDVTHISQSVEHFLQYYEFLNRHKVRIITLEKEMDLAPELKPYLGIHRDFSYGKKTKKAAIYCRVDRPATEHTRIALEIQKLTLQDYAAKHHIQITGIYEDDGIPGHTLDRPGLQAMMRDAHAGAFDTVLIVNLTRLYRGDLPMPKELRDLPVKVCSLNTLERNHLTRE